jgi:Zn-dependent protease
MASIQRGSFHLFRFAGVDVFLHWSWFLVAIIEINWRGRDYSSPLWNVYEYLALFLIVLLHEYGHALACKQVGGTANRIMLWPLGGVAYVMPPQRPGAVLWSIAAGPLVNVALLFVLPALAFLASMGGAFSPNVHTFVRAVWTINLLLLIFNILPIYPLDGGQILRALLWFPLGRMRSLMVATIIGFAGGAALILLAVAMQSPWMIILAAFMLISCWQGLRQALAMSRALKAPRRLGFACPDCKTAPPSGPYWVCGKCRRPFDTFESQAVCPYCSNRFATTMCVSCGHLHPMNQWIVPALAGGASRAV